MLTLALLWSVSLFAQSSGVQGVIQDETGAVVPGASIRVVNKATGVVNNATSNTQGFYSLPFLGPGTYDLQATQTGFAPLTQENLKLDVGQTARLDFTLRVGEVTQTVEVGASAALLETETTTVGQVIENRRIVEMPLNKRNYLELARLAPGVLPAAQLNNGARTGYYEAGFVSMGMRAYQTNILLDGVDNSSRSGGGPLGWQAQATKPSVDAVSEFKVVTNNFSAEHGYRMGAKVMVSIKSGSNRMHGSAYEFLRNDKFDGSNFFANRSGSRKPSYRQNQFGATVGGKLIRDRTFYFFSYEGTRIRIGRSLLSTVPSAAALRGDFSNERLNLNRIFDPATTTGAGAAARRLPFAGNIIPASRFDPVSGPLLQLYPAPNVPGREFLDNNYFRSPSDLDDTNQIDWRIDHSFSTNHRFFFRYSRRRQDTVTNSPLPTEAGGTGGEIIDLNGDNFVANWTQSIRPTVFNEVRFGWTNFPTRFDTLLQEPLNAKYGIKNSPGDTFNDGLNQSFTQFNTAGYAVLGLGCCWPNINNLVNMHINDNLVWQRGKHGIKTGFEMRRPNLFREASRQRRGQFSFSKVFTAEQPNVAASRTATGNGLADMMLGQASSAAVGNPAGENFIAPSWGAYVQDDWKVNSRLTVNMGLRWDLFQGAYYPTGMNPGRGGVSTYLTEWAGVPAGDARYETFLRPANGKDCGCKQDYNNFAPRIGIAYQVTKGTVIRSGFGLFYAEADGASYSRWVNQTPDFTEVNVPSDNITPAAIVRNGLPLVQLPASAPVRNTGVNTRPPEIVTQYSTQWFFDVQRELPGSIVMTLGYQGTKSTHLFVSRNVNHGGPHPSIPENQRRIRPFWNGVSYAEYGANANYNAFTARGEKRFSKGLTFLASYTWSHNIDQNTESLDTGFDVIANPYNLRAERGNSNLDQRQVFTTSATYELPFGRGKGLGSDWHGAVDAVLGGWQVGGILTLRTGFPFEVTYPGDPQNSGTTNRGDRIGSGKLENPTIDRWFDQFAFVQSAPGVFGNTGRNVLYGPGARNFDLSLAKRFRMPWEGHYLQFRFESFNFTNTPRFSQPVGGLRAANTGTISRADEPRRIQFGLKYVF
ncbi:MAG: carboxypeptidase regulatory-like domain-containing protein [Bryobacteraceae bacterium]|nr:carboxypeptidase regulatory-like domain-containing protein [Bryobacteraceae bacterium]